MHPSHIMTQREIIRSNLNESDWEITKDKCDSTRAHRRHLAANRKHENKRKIYCTNVHLRIIEILITLMYKLSAVTAAVTTGLGGGAAGRGGQARRVLWCAGLLGCCGCRRCWCADACGVVRGVCVRGWALDDVPQADAVSLCLMEGLPQAPEDIRVVLGRGEVAGVDSQGVERIGQHGFPCGLRHPTPRRPEAAVLHRPLAGPVDQALREGSPRAHFRSSQSCVWVQRCHHCPWAGPRSWAEEWAWVGVTGSWGPGDSS